MLKFQTCTLISAGKVRAISAKSSMMSSRLQPTTPRHKLNKLGGAFLLLEPNNSAKPHKKKEEKSIHNFQNPRKLKERGTPRIRDGRGKATEFCVDLELAVLLSKWSTRNEVVTVAAESLDFPFSIKDDTNS